MEISRSDLASIKRVNANSKKIVRKLEVLKRHIDELSAEYNNYVEEYKAIESYVVTKWGFYSEQILNGEADAAIAAANERLNSAESEAEEAPAPTIDDMPEESVEESSNTEVNPFGEA